MAGTFEHAEVDRSPAEAVSSVPAAPTPKPRGATGQSGRLTQDQLDFLDWLCTPADLRGQSQNEWERDHGYGPGTCSRWKNTNVGFRAALRQRFDDENSAPDVVQEVIRSLRDSAIRKGDTKAAVDWLRVTGNFVDRSIIQSTTNMPSEMSEDELVAELRQELERLEGRRQVQ